MYKEGIHAKLKFFFISYFIQQQSQAFSVLTIYSFVWKLILSDCNGPILSYIIWIIQQILKDVNKEVNISNDINSLKIHKFIKI